MNTPGGDHQLPLFGESDPKAIGHASVEHIQASSILTKASGFMDAYDFTLNPYSGCSFGCTYCYAAFFARDADLRNQWGYWVKAKTNAISMMAKIRKPIEGKKIYMSSVTDPYQPIEKKLELTRGILQLLVKKQPHLVVQTRSALVTRDLDLLRQFDNVRVNMTVTTDSEVVRKAFEPMCPSNQQRLDAIRDCAEAGVDTAITMTPLLPVDDPESFAKELATARASRYVVQPFHAERGKFVRGTRDEALEITRRYNWTFETYQHTVGVLRQYLPSLVEGKDGFLP